MKRFARRNFSHQSGLIMQFKKLKKAIKAIHYYKTPWCTSWEFYPILISTFFCDKHFDNLEFVMICVSIVLQQLITLWWVFDILPWVQIPTPGLDTRWNLCPVHSINQLNEHDLFRNPVPYLFVVVWIDAFWSSSFFHSFTCRVLVKRSLRWFWANVSWSRDF